MKATLSSLEEEQGTNKKSQDLLLPYLMDYLIILHDSCKPFPHVAYVNFPVGGTP